MILDLARGDPFRAGLAPDLEMFGVHVRRQGVAILPTFDEDEGAGLRHALVQIVADAAFFLLRRCNHDAGGGNVSSRFSGLMVMVAMT